MLDIFLFNFCIYSLFSYNLSFFFFFNYFSLSNEDWSRIRIEFQRYKLKIRVICKSELYSVSRQINASLENVTFLSFKQFVFSKRFASLLLNRHLYSNQDIIHFCLLNVNLFSCYFNSTVTTICLGEREYAKHLFIKYTTATKAEAIYNITSLLSLYKMSISTFITLGPLLYVRYRKVKFIYTCYILLLLIYNSKMSSNLSY